MQKSEKKVKSRRKWGWKRGKEKAEKEKAEKGEKQRASEAQKKLEEMKDKM